MNQVDYELRKLKLDEQKLKSKQENKYTPKEVADVENKLVVVIGIGKNGANAIRRGNMMTDKKVEYYKISGKEKEKAGANDVFKTGITFNKYEKKNKGITNTVAWATTVYNKYLKDPKKFNPRKYPHTVPPFDAFTEEKIKV